MLPPLATLPALRLRLRTLGANPSHADRVLRLWAQARPQDSGKRRLEDFMPKAVREALPAFEADLNGLATLRSEHPAEDGSARLLVALADGQTVESVLLPRDGLCVSTPSPSWTRCWIWWQRATPPLPSCCSTPASTKAWSASSPGA